MRDYLNIGSTPAGESCAQVGSSNYYNDSMVECIVFKHQLERLFPDGCFSKKAFYHEFGTYYEIVAWFETDLDETGEELSSFLQKQEKAAYDAEANTPEYWDEEAIRELAAAGVTVDNRDRQA